ncbi:EscR/YscR/HrcR family type III secretion system export apparatus protein [Robbsia sp. KACC 23696]|uniref:EscR/YscR/HrcR family type III secretion system export apparatus protein n=1 Tax=Robbsia sp. KACC 23696 TaxID=3149231 RepID=UPI00325BA178
MTSGATAASADIGGSAPSMSAPPSVVNGYGGNARSPQSRFGATAPRPGTAGMPGTAGTAGIGGGTSRQTAAQAPSITLDTLLRAVAAGVDPFKGFLMHNSRPEHRAFFVDTARRMWTNTLAADVKEDDLLILIPAFVLSEMDAAFKMGFLLYLPFVLIDLIVSNILLAMGMMMVSPVTISLPLKLFLFVMVNGWTRLIQGLVLSYL